MFCLFPGRELKKNVCPHREPRGELIAQYRQPMSIRYTTPEWFDIRRREVPLAQLDNKSRGCCCRNSRPTVINPDLNMNKQLFMKHINDRIRSNPPNRAPLPNCLHCDVKHLSLATRIVVLHIPSWRVREREERRRVRKIVWSINAGRMICCHRNHFYGITIHDKHFEIHFWKSESQV